jgi:hypothetical protein
MRTFFVVILIALFCASTTFAGNGNPEKPVKAYDGVKCANSKASSGAGTAMKSTAHAKNAGSASRPAVGTKKFHKNFNGYNTGNSVKSGHKKVRPLGSGSGSIKTSRPSNKASFGKKHYGHLKTRRAGR